MPELRWEKAGNGLLSPDSTFVDGSFRIGSARGSDQAEYFCLATNVAGSHRARAVLFVRGGKWRTLGEQNGAGGYSIDEVTSFSFNVSVVGALYLKTDVIDTHLRSHHSISKNIKSFFFFFNYDIMFRDAYTGAKRKVSGLVSMND